MKRLGSSFKKKARRVSVNTLEELHISAADFRPAEFHSDIHNVKRIIHYDPQRLFNYGFLNPRGSVLNWGMVVRTLLMCGVGTFVSQYRCASTPTHYSFCFPVIPAAEGLIFASLVSFLLGLFVSTTFSRWWSTREKLSTVMNNTLQLTMLLGNFVNPEPELKASLKKVLRWMHLAHALIYKQANDDDDYLDLVDAKVATIGEADRLSELKEHYLPAIVYGWCLFVLKPILVSNKISPAGAITAVLASITACFNASQEVSALLRTQMPYSYIHLLTITTKIHLAFVVFYAGGIIAQGITGNLWTRIVFGYTVIITNNVIYEGLLNIHKVLVNPLGDDDADFPTHLYVADTIALGNALQLVPPQEDEADKSKIYI